MTVAQDRFEKMVEALRGNGHRITPQRLAILKILSASEGHPAAEQIYQGVKKHFPTTSLATVYKTLTVLKDLKEVLVLEFSELPNRYDGFKPYDHPHLICLRCGSIDDPELLALGTIKRQLTEQTGFQITNSRLDFFGVCPKCREVDGK